MFQLISLRIRIVSFSILKVYQFQFKKTKAGKTIIGKIKQRFAF